MSWHQDINLNADEPQAAVMENLDSMKLDGEMIFIGTLDGKSKCFLDMKIAETEKHTKETTVLVRSI